MSTGPIHRIVFLAATLSWAACGFAQPINSPTLGPTSRGSIPLRNDILTDLHGVLLLEPKIIGGLYTKEGADPWQVALVRAEKTGPDRRPFCGGSLISPKWVVTAAHCVDRGTLPTDFDVIGGTTDVNNGGVRLKVAEIVVHPNYTRADHLNDIALVRLQQPIIAPQAREIAILPLAQEATVLKWKATARVTGWGALSEGGVSVAELRYVELTVYSNKDCNDRVAYNGAIADDMVCAGFAAEARDSCQGDSGGPLTVQADGKRYLAGIVSWGDGCARPNKYGVYTRAARYVTWLEDCMSGEARCRQPDLEKQKMQAAFTRDASLRRALQFTRESK
jgi:secreted trypsin-like serine protease